MPQKEIISYGHFLQSASLAKEILGPLSSAGLKGRPRRMIKSTELTGGDVTVMGWTRERRRAAYSVCAVNQKVRRVQWRSHQHATSRAYVNFMHPGILATLWLSC